MQIKSFFKILNRKINTYDKMASNPFAERKRLVIVWIEDGVVVNNLKNEEEKEIE